MAFIRQLLHFIYPTYCLHCDGPVKRANQTLCPECFLEIEWIEKKERCPMCWGPDKCRKCPPLHPHRSLFESCGPIPLLFQEFQRTKRANTLASFIVLGLDRTSWPLPDIIVPLTEGPFHKSEPSYLLAKTLAKMLELPCLLPSNKVRDKTVLFLIDRLSSAKKVIEARSYLKGFFPRKVYSIALIDER